MNPVQVEAFLCATHGSYFLDKSVVIVTAVITVMAAAVSSA